MINSLQKYRFQLDILRLPLVGRFLKWKHSRTAGQIVLFALAAAIIIDGLFGSQLAPKNVATVAAWVHYRGLVVLALLLAGNLFCAACPFMLPRKLAKWMGRPTRRWPKALRNKWIAVIALVAIIYGYELFDLWATPWWTAWLAVAYFAAAFAIEALFTRSSFCMYVCPLGTFNFLYSTLSPTQITARSLDTCRTCATQDCINGNEHENGCQLELFVPTMQSNMNCTLCMDCVHACPYDNVALAVRPPGDELFHQTWRHRLDLAFLAIVTGSLGLVNAFGMTPPYYVLEVAIAHAIGIHNEPLVLGLVILLTGVVVPLGLSYGAAWLGRTLTRSNESLNLALASSDASLNRTLTSSDESLNRIVMRYAYSFVPLGFAIWFAHYLFHFLTGALTIVPAFQTFFAQTLGWPLLGAPNWQLAARFVPPVSVIQIIQTVITYGGLFLAVSMALGAARKAHKQHNRALLEALPWLVLLIGLAVASGMTFLLPMEMRGSALGG